ncbi:MAG: toll/interleukin-1 receptor domain-containing protein [Candidatus Abyssobacteria bacterium SURF_5]|uniref:ADP-ribosyl cyclase/cyclic ADP-ribose hydrolase n=1 Tax=Abyssobacteria bacterium (strain SURF_5) TaxID=2093360 RepID=A0A3A4P276_ABYX5|nr:MAG: toll/interleukin-1 receptor domain-containing protein [Candidatus Abyssubacteria bacterium SURF_5]
MDRGNDRWIPPFSKPWVNGKKLKPESQEKIVQPDKSIAFGERSMKWDAFISYASEDKPFVSALANALRGDHHLEIWFDDHVLQVGDSISRAIEQGLRHSHWGIVVLSPHYFRKKWPKAELAALRQKGNSQEDVILPIFHNITPEEIRGKDILLADIKALPSYIGVPEIARQITAKIELYKSQVKSSPDTLRKEADRTVLISCNSENLPDDLSSSTVEQEIADTSMGKRHVVILGAGASLAAFPEGDRNGRKLPLMNDIIDVVGLRELLESDKVNCDGTNFEEIYSALTEDESSKLPKLIEYKVDDYFRSLQLPDEPTIYDYLVMSLRPKDLIATFNWDPLLYMTCQRNYQIVDPPKVVFLHGNVAVGYCPEHSNKGGSWLRGTCKICGKRFQKVPLLYCQRSLKTRHLGSNQTPPF